MFTSADVAFAPSPVSTRLSTPAGGGVGDALRVSSARAGSVAKYRTPPAAGSTNSPWMSTTRCTGTRLKMQNRPSGSIGTTERFDVAPPTG
jgi:hypothetical protein